MPYCPRCLVELGLETALCPLCGSRAQPARPEYPAPYPTDDDARPEPLPWLLLRKRIAEGLSLLLFVPMLVVLIIDLIMSGRISWSVYSLGALAFAWAMGLLLLYRHRNLTVLGWGSFLCISGMLSLFDGVSGGFSWFPRLALPTVAFFYCIVAALVFMARRSRRDWLKLAAWSLVGISLFCLSLDLLINSYTGKSVIPTWSLLVAAALLPILIFLLYLHYRVAKAVDMKKIFHI